MSHSLKLSEKYLLLNEEILFAYKHIIKQMLQICAEFILIYGLQLESSM